MEKNNNKSIVLAVIITVLVMLVLIMGYEMYQMNNKISQMNLESTLDEYTSKVNEIETKTNDVENNATNEASNIELVLGSYQADEEKFDEIGISYKECGVTLAENNLCSVYEGEGEDLLGTYEIKDNKLICNTLISRGQEGGISYSEGNVIIEFEILSENQIKLSKISNISNTFIDTLGLEIGMTYSFNKDANIKVLIDNK